MTRRKANHGASLRTASKRNATTRARERIPRGPKPIRRKGRSVTRRIKEMGFLGGNPPSARDDPAPKLHVPGAMAVTVVLLDETPSLNQLMKGWHWRDARRWQNAARMVLRASLVHDAEENGWPLRIGRETRAASLHIHRVGWSLIKDDDNIHGGCKPVRDALVQIGLLRDDDRKSLTGTTYTEETTRDRRRTVITVRYGEAV